MAALILRQNISFPPNTFIADTHSDGTYLFCSGYDTNTWDPIIVVYKRIGSELEYLFTEIVASAHTIHFNGTYLICMYNADIVSAGIDLYEFSESGLSLISHAVAPGGGSYGGTFLVTYVEENSTWHIYAEGLWAYQLIGSTLTQVGYTANAEIGIDSSNGLIYTVKYKFYSLIDVLVYSFSGASYTLVSSLEVACDPQYIAVLDTEICIKCGPELIHLHHNLDTNIITLVETVEAGLYIGSLQADENYFYAMHIDEDVWLAGINIWKLSPNLTLEFIDTFSEGAITLYGNMPWVFVSYSNGTELRLYEIVVGSTVTYNGNGSTGGTVPVDSNVYEEGDTVTVLDKGDLVKTNNIFVYWNTSSDGSGTSYDSSDTFLIGAEAITLYAIWVEVHVGGLIGYNPADKDLILRYEENTIALAIHSNSTYVFVASINTVIAYKIVNKELQKLFETEVSNVYDLHFNGTHLLCLRDYEGADLYSFSELGLTLVSHVEDMANFIQATYVEEDDTWHMVGDYGGLGAYKLIDSTLTRVDYIDQPHPCVAYANGLIYTCIEVGYYNFHIRVYSFSDSSYTMQANEDPGWEGFVAPSDIVIIGSTISDIIINLVEYGRWGGEGFISHYTHDLETSFSFIEELEISAGKISGDGAYVYIPEYNYNNEISVWEIDTTLTKIYSNTTSYYLVVWGDGRWVVTGGFNNIVDYLDELKLFEIAAPDIAIDCYWDSEVSGITESIGGGEPKTTSDMKVKYTPGVYDTWDYDNVWYQNEPEEE